MSLLGIAPRFWFVTAAGALAFAFVTPLIIIVVLVVSLTIAESPSTVPDSAQTDESPRPAFETFGPPVSSSCVAATDSNGTPADDTD